MLSYDEINKLTSAYYEPMQLNKRQKKEREELSHVLFDFFQDMLIDLALLDSESDDYEDILSEVTYQYKNGYVNTLEKHGFDLDKYDELKDYAPTLIQSVIDVTLDDKANKYTFDDKRALNMALNEANKVLNYSDFVDAVESGKTSKTWLTMNDDKVRDTHNDLEGMTIGIYSLFPVGIYQMAYPMDMSHGAGLEEVIGCRCSVDYGNENVYEVFKSIEVNNWHEEYFADTKYFIFGKIYSAKTYTEFQNDIFEIMQSNEFGRTLFNVIKDKKCEVLFNYRPRRYENEREPRVTEKAHYDPTHNRIVLFVNENENIYETINDLIHEANHLLWDRPNSKTQELDCSLAPYRFRGIEITEELVLKLSRNIDKAYDWLMWEDEV